MATATKKDKGRQIYLTSDQIESLAGVTESQIVSCDDDIHMIEGYIEYAEGDDLKYWEQEKADKLAEKAKWQRIINKLWYYSDRPAVAANG